jgi:hypothetical protein
LHHFCRALGPVLRAIEEVPHFALLEAAELEARRLSSLSTSPGLAIWMRFLVSVAVGTLPLVMASFLGTNWSRAAVVVTHWSVIFSQRMGSRVMPIRLKNRAFVTD